MAWPVLCSLFDPVGAGISGPGGVARPALCEIPGAWSYFGLQCPMGASLTTQRMLSPARRPPRLDQFWRLATTCLLSMACKRMRGCWAAAVVQLVESDVALPMCCLHVALRSVCTLHLMPNWAVRSLCAWAWKSFRNECAELCRSEVRCAMGMYGI